jgi:hypothetical protein
VLEVLTISPKQLDDQELHRLRGIAAGYPVFGAGR